MNKRDRQILDVATALFAIATGAAVVFAGSLPILSGIGVAAILLIAFLGLIDRDTPIETEDVEAQEDIIVVQFPREKLAALAHAQWSGWMLYLFSKCEVDEDAGFWTVPSWAVQRWTRQMSTPYCDLSEEEKESDRREADRTIEVLHKERAK